jgi:hypothetical protein
MNRNFLSDADSELEVMDPNPAPELDCVTLTIITTKISIFNSYHH